MEELYSTKNYIKTSAIIVDHVKTINSGIQNDSNTSIYKMIRVSYNNQYYASMRVCTYFLNEIGDSRIIYYNEADPESIRDEFKIYSSVCIMAFLLFYVIGMKICMRKNDYYA